jgi:putative inorganic carbon (HCO3(-)) transporter
LVVGSILHNRNVHTRSLARDTAGEDLMGAPPLQARAIAGRARTAGPIGRHRPQIVAREATGLAAADLRLRSLLRGLRDESVALTLLCVYIVFEYLRPQAMFRVIDVLPWGTTTLTLAVVGALVVSKPVRGMNALDALIALFMLALWGSMLFAYDTDASLKAWSTAATMGLLYFSVRAILTSPGRLLLFSLFFLLVNLKFSQHSTRSFVLRGFSFQHWGVSGMGWFANSGELAMQMGVAFFLSLGILIALRGYVTDQRRWWFLMALFPGTALITIAASSSRGGQLALAVTALFMLLKPPQLLKKLVGLLALAALLFVLLPSAQIDRFRTAGEDGTSESRKAYWAIGRDIVKEKPLGIGFSNWRAYYGTFHWDRERFARLEVSHNSFVDAFVELGLHGGILFLVLLGTAFGLNVRTYRRLKRRSDVESAAIAGIARGVNLGLLSSCVAGFFMSVLYYPVFWLAFAMTAAAHQLSMAPMRSRSPSTFAHRMAAAPNGAVGASLR